MKKLNNKGFAISTLIYGLAIMGIMIVAILMATMAQTRNNTSSLVKSIEEELNRFSRTETTFKPTGDAMQFQEYIVPTSGWYKIELWGAQGGGNNGGKGAYTGGIIELVQGDTLYFYVGPHKSSGGGYSSSVRVRSGSYDDSLSYETSIMIAAGGGSASTASGGTLLGYNDKMNSVGGFINSKIGNGNFSLIETGNTNPTNGTLIGFVSDYDVSNNATNPGLGIPVPSPEGSNGGGDGYFSSNNSSTGGTSFIAGYSGCYGISKGETKLNSRVDYYKHVYREDDTVVMNEYETTKQGEYYFVDGIMLPGVRKGDGYAKVERVKAKIETNDELPRKNNKLNNIRYVRDCTTPSTTLNKIVATVKGATIEKTSSAADSCKIVDLGSEMNVDEIAVFHITTGVDYKDNKISVSTDGVNWSDIKKESTSTHYSETETLTGYRVSAYQYDSTNALPMKGNYIIKPVLSENKVLTAEANSEEDANPITLEPYNGEKRQIWAIEVITDTKLSPGYIEGNPSTYEYKIMELARYNALTISQDENIAFNTVSTLSKFNEKARNEPQIWKIVPAGNGTYTISTVVPDSGSNTGNLIPQTNSTLSTSTYNQIIIGKNNEDTARFKLIQVDYSGE